MLAGMVQTAVLFDQVFWLEIKFGAAGHNVFVGDIEIDEDIGFGEAQPHVLDMGMFLGDMMDLVTGFAQDLNQGAFTGGTRADDGDAEGAFVFLIHLWLEGKTAVQPPGFFTRPFQDGHAHDADVVTRPPFVEGNGLI